MQMLFLEFVNELTGTYVAYYLAIYSYITGNPKYQDPVRTHRSEVYT